MTAPRLQTREAYVGVTGLALFLLAWGVVYVATVPLLPAWPFVLLSLVAAVGLATLFATRTRPNENVATAISVVAIAAFLILVPWTAFVWCAMKRPWEAFAHAQLAMIGMAFVAPRLFGIGIALIGLFAASAVTIFACAWRIGLGQLIPVIEPFNSCFFGVVGIGLLVLRMQRSELERKHLRLLAEAQALRRVGPLLGAVRRQLDEQLAVVGIELGRIGAAGPAGSGLKLVDRAVARTSALSGRLECLERDPGPDAMPPSSREAEQLLLGREAHLGAEIIAMLLLSSSIMVLIGTRGLEVGVTPILWSGYAVLSIAALVYLFFTRARPSERVALAITMGMVLLALLGISYNQQQFLELGRPYTPFVGNKLLMVITALLFTHWLWLSAGIICVVLSTAIAQYFAFDLARHTDILPMAEPWATLVFAVVAVALLLVREQRRLVSIALLRAESETAALQRRAAMLLAVRDLLNTPLQTLLLWLEHLQLGHPTDDVSQLRVEVERLIGLSRALDNVPGEPSGAAVSFDATDELRRIA